jgi:hypothetical protein
MNLSILVAERLELDIHIPNLYFNCAIKGPKSEKTTINAEDYIKLQQSALLLIVFKY